MFLLFAINFDLLKMLLVKLSCFSIQSIGAILNFDDVDGNFLATINLLRMGTGNLSYFGEHLLFVFVCTPPRNTPQGWRDGQETNSSPALPCS